MRRSLRILCMISAICSPGLALAVDHGQIGDVPDNVRAWFKAVKNRDGVPCCDIADGHRTTWEVRGTQYWVPIKGKLVPIPEDKIIWSAGNPYGEAVVWYVEFADGDVLIRCFVPGGGV